MEIIDIHALYVGAIANAIYQATGAQTVIHELPAAEGERDIRLWAIPEGRTEPVACVSLRMGRDSVRLTFVMQGGRQFSDASTYAEGIDKICGRIISFARASQLEEA